MNINERTQKLIDDGIIGIEEYSEPKQSGGQICGMRMRGTRVWTPKDEPDFPAIDIRFCNHRSQYKNRRDAITLFEIAAGL